MLFHIDKTNLFVGFNEGIQIHAYSDEPYLYVEIEEFVKNESSPVIVENFHFSTKPHPHHRDYFVLPIKFYYDFQVSVYKVVLDYGLSKIYSHRFNDTGKVVKFELDTEDKKEAKIWLDSVMEYCKIHSCDPIIKSKFDDINRYSNPYYLAKDIEPYKTYFIGRFPKNSSDWRTIDPRKEGLIWFGNWKTFWSYEHPRCWKQLTSKEIANDILGLN